MKRKSKTSIKMKEQKLSKLQRRVHTKKSEDASTTRNKKSGGSNGWGDDDGFDLPPEGGDEFDMNDLMGSVQKQTHKSNPLLDTNNVAQQSVQLSVASGEQKEKWTRKIQKVNFRDVAVASSGDKANALSSKKQTDKNNVKKEVTPVITANTPIREIIESCSNPKPPKKAVASSSSTDMSKQEKRKAFFEKKKLKKRKRGSDTIEDDDSDDHASRHQEFSSVGRTSQRPAFDDQVERPPTFTMLPRGANKLVKNKKTNNCKNANNTSDDDDSAAMRIQREQQALDALRKKVVQQYAILRENRRSGAGR